RIHRPRRQGRPARHGGAHGPADEIERHRIHTGRRYGLDSGEAAAEQVGDISRRDHLGGAGRDGLPRDPPGHEMTILEALRSRLRFIAWNVILVTLVALGVSLILPKWYSAKAVLLPPTEEDSSFSLSQLLPRGLSGLKMPGAPTLSDVFVS